KNFVYAYAQQANLSVERDLGHGFALNLAYNFNGGRHLNRPINANTIRGDLMVANFEAAYYDALLTGGTPPASPFTVSGCNAGGRSLLWARLHSNDHALMTFCRPGACTPSFTGLSGTIGDPGGSTPQPPPPPPAPGLKNCDPATFAGCIPFGDMD